MKRFTTAVLATATAAALSFGAVAPAAQAATVSAPTAVSIAAAVKVKTITGAENTLLVTKKTTATGKAGKKVTIPAGSVLWSVRSKGKSWVATNALGEELTIAKTAVKKAEQGMAVARKATTRYVLDKNGKTVAKEKVFKDAMFAVFGYAKNGKTMVLSHEPGRTAWVPTKNLTAQKMSVYRTTADVRLGTANYKGPLIKKGTRVVATESYDFPDKTSVLMLKTSDGLQIASFPTAQSKFKKTGTVMSKLK